MVHSEQIKVSLKIEIINDINSYIEGYNYSKDWTSRKIIYQHKLFVDIRIARIRLLRCYAFSEFLYGMETLTLKININDDERL